MSDSGLGAPERGRGRGSPLGQNAWCRWYECRGCECSRVFVAHDDAIRWLQTTVAGPCGMIDIRSALNSCGDDLALSRVDDQGVIVQLAALLVNGRVRVCGDQANVGLKLPEAHWPSAASARATSTAVPISSVIAPSPRSSRPPAPVEEKQAAELDVAAMVATLRAAAKNGTPFCEECARAARQAA